MYFARDNTISNSLDDLRENPAQILNHSIRESIKTYPTSFINNSPNFIDMGLLRLRKIKCIQDK